MAFREVRPYRRLLYRAVPKRTCDPRRGVDFGGDDGFWHENGALARIFNRFFKRRPSAVLVACLCVADPERGGSSTAESDHNGLLSHSARGVSAPPFSLSLALPPNGGLLTCLSSPNRYLGRVDECSGHKNGSDQLNDSHEGTGQFVLTCGDGSERFEPAHQSRHAIAVPIEFPILGNKSAMFA